MRKTLVPFLLSFIFLIQISAQQKPVFLTNKDKAFIIKSILLKKDFLNRDLSVDERREFINLSLENIAPELLPKIKGINFVLFNQQQIEEKVKTGFLYYSFGSFEPKDSQVLINFGFCYENIEGKTAYSTGITYEFKKVKGVWIGREFDGFTSTTE